MDGRLKTKPNENYKVDVKYRCFTISTNKLKLLTTIINSSSVKC